MSCAYDPFRYADIYGSEEEYFKDLEEENMGTKIEIDLDEITAKLDELKKNEAEYKFLLKQAQDEIEKLELKLIAVLDKTGAESMDFGVYSWGWKTTSRTALDQKYLKENYADVYNACYLTKEKRNFEFKINKYGSK